MGIEAVRVAVFVANAAIYVYTALTIMRMKNKRAKIGRGAFGVYVFCIAVGQVAQVSHPYSPALLFISLATVAGVAWAVWDFHCFRGKGDSA